MRNNIFVFIFYVHVCVWVGISLIYLTQYPSFVEGRTYHLVDLVQGEFILFYFIIGIRDRCEKINADLIHFTAITYVQNVYFLRYFVLLDIFGIELIHCEQIAER